MKRLDRELTTYLDTLTAGLGRPERRTAMRQYVTGLLLDGERKSIEPIAARLVDRATEVQAMRQRLQQCIVSNSPRSSISSRHDCPLPVSLRSIHGCGRANRNWVTIPSTVASLALSYTPAIE